MHTQHYQKLLITTILSFISMYALMYTMVNTFDHIYLNINRFYMAVLMSAPMVIFMIVVMRSMYMNKKLNALIIGVSMVVIVVFFLFIREQSAVSDKQFLKSMIPHHSSAILMCEQANLQNPEIKELCKTIIAGQQAEIDQMKAMLGAYKN